MLQGYHSPLYAKAYEHEGEILKERFLGGSLIKRPIPGTEYHDISNVYPFHCPWEDEPVFGWNLESSEGLGDIQEAHPEAIGLTLVTSPFMSLSGVADGTVYAPKWDDRKVYKPHYIVDFSQPLTIRGSHYDQVRKFARLGGEVVQEPLFPHTYIDQAREFHKGYKYLIKRHKAEGTFADFSERSLIHMFSAPGSVLFKALYKGKVIGQILCYIMGDTAHYFLASPSHKAYGIGANFALQYFALMYFRQIGLRYYSLGGSTDGANNSETLGSYKEGWSNLKKDSYILQKDFRPDIIKELTGDSDSEFLPPYRGK